MAIRNSGSLLAEAENAIITAWLPWGEGQECCPRCGSDKTSEVQSVDEVIFAQMVCRTCGAKGYPAYF